MQRGQVGKSIPDTPSITNSEDMMKITVFTSTQCHFCNEAVRVVEKTLEGLPFYEPLIEIVETAIEDEPDLIENLDILAVPTIFVSKSRIVGLPRTEDVEQLIHQELLRLGNTRSRRK
jgi:protein-disulfide isomerase